MRREEEKGEQSRGQESRHHEISLIASSVFFSLLCERGSRFESSDVVATGPREIGPEIGPEIGRLGSEHLWSEFARIDK